MVKQRRGAILLAFLLVIFGWVSATAQAQTILHVNRTDPTCGGQSPCFSTIQAALSSAGPNSVIRIQAGTYPDQLSIVRKNNFPGASEVDRIIIEADPTTQPGQVVLTGAPGACTGNYAIRLQQSKFITIRGLTITGTGGQAISLLGGNNQNQDIHIELNRIFANGSSACGGGIAVARGNPGTLIVNNLIFANGRNGVSFLDADGGPHYLINNTIYGNQWNGVDVARNHTITLANNIINNNGTAPGTTGGRFGVRREGSTAPQPAGIKLLNNLICGNTQGEISVQVLDATDSSNFTPLSNEGTGVGELPGCELPANLFGNLNGPDNQPNTADDDFSLKPNSLAIDVGMDPRTLGFNPSYNPIFEADFVIEGIRSADGNADGIAAFDAGAFEFVGDIIPPQLDIVSPDAGAYVRDTITVSAQATDNVAVTSITLNAGGQSLPLTISPPLPTLSATASGLWNTTSVGDGNVSISASAVDSSSNTGSATRAVIVDNSAPDTQITGGPTGSINQTTAAFTFTGSDNFTPVNSLVFAWRIDGGAWSSFNPDTSVTVSNLGGGSHTFEVKARDLAGNEDPTPDAGNFTVQLGPTITTVDPPSGIIGTLVTMTGAGFEPATTQVAFNNVPAVIRTITPTEITTTVPPTATTGLLTVTTSRGIASRNFTVPTSQDFALVISPSGISTVQGGSAGVLIDAIPTNGFSGLIQLAPGSLPTGVFATFAPSTLAPNNYSVLTLRTSAPTPSGAHVIEIRGSSPIDGQTVTHAANVTLNVVAPGQTVLVGQVLDGDDRPLPNVSIKLGGTTLTHLGSSDAAGNLFIPLSVSGPTVFLIDGSPANSSTTNYSTIPVTLDIQPAVVNELGYVPRLRGQPVARLIPFIPGQATVITDPDLPGFKMTIPSGVQIIGWDGQPNNQVSVTTVPIDRSPLPPLPAGLSARQIYLFNFGKMGGGIPTGNIPIDTPNDVDGLPGEKIDLYYFNEAPDGTAPNQWEKYGTGTVSPDGTRIITDINPATGLPYGIPRFCCGARVNVPPPPPPRPGGGPSGGPADSGKKDGEPVDTATGFFYLDKTDMVLPGLLSIAINRTYRTQLTNAGPFGLGTSWPYDVFLQPPPNGSADTLILFTPGNRQDLLSRQVDGSFLNTTSPALRSAIVTVAGGVRSLRFKDGSVWRFDTAGRIINQSDRNGNTVTLTRDSQGRVTRITEPSGRQLIMSYTGANLRIDGIQDPIGRQILYSYDASGRLSTVTDAAGGITRYTYDTSHRMVSITDPRGITFLTNEYDSAGRVFRQTQADGSVWTFTYVTTGNFISQTTVTNPRGHATTYRFNSAGYLIAQTDAFGQTTSFERETGTNLLFSTTDSLGRIVRFTYNANGNLLTVTDPAGNLRRFEYEPIFNKLTKITDPLGNVTSFSYDAKGNMTDTTDPAGARTTIAYNNFGQPMSTTDSLENTATIAYDTSGNLAMLIDPLGNKTQRAHDLVSRLIEQTDPRGRSTQLTYDGLNRITGITDPANGVTQFSYDGNGNLLTVTDARGSVTGYSYDSMDHLATRTDPVGAIESFQYDGMGNLTRHIDRKGQLTTFAYDALNRRTGGSYADGSITDFVYDAVGRLIEGTDSVGGTIANQYDTLNRLIAQITNLGTISYEYDSTGRRTRMNVPGQSLVTYGYDAASRLKQVVQGSQVVDIQYDALGRRTLLTLPNTVSTEYQYDAASRLTALVYRNTLGVLGDLTYQYDRAGNRTAVGGSFARTLLPDPVDTATYDAANRQLAFGDNTMVFDANGSLTSITEASGTTTFGWDARNRLAGLNAPSTSTTFTYDVFGRRTGRAVNAQQFRYQYDFTASINEWSDTSLFTNLTGLGVDEPFTRTDVQTTLTTNFLSDTLGSTIALANAGGGVQTEYTYEPFGKTTATGNSNTNPFQFTGRENDGSSLYYYRARYYHPGLQRFISEDPIGFAAGDLNLFAYVRNSATNFRDPSGKFVPAAVVGGVLCATGAVAGAAGYQQLSGRKSTFGGLLAGAAAGCAAGLGLGWAIGIALEAAVPSVMAGGGEVVLWGGLGSTGVQLAGAEAAATGSATIMQTFTGSALKLAEAAGLSYSLTLPWWKDVSARFVSGAGSATALVGSSLTEASVLLTTELPVLRDLGVNITYVLFP